MGSTNEQRGVLTYVPSMEETRSVVGTENSVHEIKAMFT